MTRGGAAFPILLVLVPAIALAGCLGSNAPDEAVEPAAAMAPQQATLAVVHRPADTTIGTVALAELLPGIPLPLGATRYTGSWGFEPTVGTTTDGAIFVSSLLAVTPTTEGDQIKLYRSRDQGLTWEDATPKIAGAYAHPHVSFDPYVHVDTDTDRVFVSDLGPLACAALSFSDDGGHSWTTNPIGCGHPVAPHDHQTVFTAKARMVPTAGYANVVYYCVNRLVDTACATSLNGGVAFGPLVPVDYGGEVCGGVTAHGTAAPDGTAYLGAGKCGKPVVAISRDDGLTWEPVVISETVGTVQGSADSHEVATAVDEAGNVYAFWIGEDRLPYLAASTDAGASWGEALMVGAPGVRTTSHPTIAAGADGRVAVAYVGTTAEKEYDEMEPADTWNAYLAVVLDAHGASPLVATSTANDPADPIGRGVCGGTRCYGEEGGGSLGDFIDVVIDASGRPWAVFVDACTKSCRDANADANDFGLGFVATFAEGPALRGELAPLAWLPNASPGEGGDGSSRTPMAIPRTG